MTPALIVGLIDVNDPLVVNRVLAAARSALERVRNWHILHVRSGVHFQTPNGPLPEGAGWYVISDRSGGPLYVGESENLNKRLNSDDGSGDNFANPTRSQDDIRNFVKAFASKDLLQDLRVGIVVEGDVSSVLGVSSPLSKLDRCNVEKVISLFRRQLNDLPTSR